MKNSRRALGTVPADHRRTHARTGRALGTGRQGPSRSGDRTAGNREERSSRHADEGLSERGDVNVFRVAEIRPFKNALVELAEQLHERRILLHPRLSAAVVGALPGRDSLRGSGP